MKVVQEEVFKFLKSTSIRGIGRILQARELGFKVLWTSAVVGFGLLCIIFTSRLIEQYTSYPKTSIIYSVSYKQEEGQKLLEEFKPSITICNGNPIRSEPEYRENVTTLDEFIEMVRNTNNTVDGFPDYFHHIGLENAKGLGHREKDIIVDCKVFYKIAFLAGLNPCSDFVSIDFTPIPNFFNCYSINIEHLILDQENDTRVTSIGLVLFADSFANGPNKSDSYEPLFPMDGIKLFFHKQNTLVPTEDITIFPGQNLQIGMSFQISEQLPSPYGTCEENHEKIPIWALQGKQLDYSRFGCQMAAIQGRIHQNCRCIVPQFPVINNQKISLEDSTNCFLVENISPTMNCVLQYAFPSEDYCLESCKDVFYRLDIMPSSWPDIKHLNSFYEQYIANKSYEGKFKNLLENRTFEDAKAALYDLVRSNFALLKIKFDLDHIFVQKEVAQFTFTSFISNLGGLLNLYSGISFIVAVEIIDLLAKIVLRWNKTRN